MMLQAKSVIRPAYQLNGKEQKDIDGLISFIKKYLPEAEVTVNPLVYGIELYIDYLRTYIHVGQFLVLFEQGTPGVLSANDVANYWFIIDDPQQELPI